MFYRIPCIYIIIFTKVYQKISKINVICKQNKPSNNYDINDDYDSRKNVTYILFRDVSFI